MSSSQSSLLLNTYLSSLYYCSSEYYNSIWICTLFILLMVRLSLAISATQGEDVIISYVLPRTALGTQSVPMFKQSHVEEVRHISTFKALCLQPLCYVLATPNSTQTLWTCYSFCPKNFPLSCFSQFLFILLFTAQVSFPSEALLIPVWHPSEGP